MKKLNKKTPISLYLAGILLCLVMISANYTSGLYAKYTTSVSASDSARVAKYDVSIDVENTTVSLSSFDKTTLSGKTSFTVKSNSEVSVKYSVVITFPNELPNYLEWRVDVGGAVVSDEKITQNGAVYTFTDIGTFAPGTYEDVVTLTFEVLPGLQAADVISDFEVNVIAEQIN